MNIKVLFLKLTDYTTPFGDENKLEQYLPKNIQKDSIGNYYLKIGDSDTMFSCHLDNVTTKRQKVNHIIDGNIIKTDGTTILGADNKAGAVVLLYMIEHQIPGLYYFFIGEEPTAPEGGLYGSKRALKQYTEQFSHYKKCIAFDRKKEGSIINRQMGRMCCSNLFIDSLSKELGNLGLEFKKDTTGYYTDTAVFMDIIPECTNLSIGVYGEHTKKESVDLNYVQKICDAAIKINWDGLQIGRELETLNLNEQWIKKSVLNFKNFKNAKNKTFDKIFNNVCWLLDSYNCLNAENFKPGVRMIFSEWFVESEYVNITIDFDENIWIDKKKIGDWTKFKQYVVSTFKINPLDLIDIEELYEQLLDHSKKTYGKADWYTLYFNEFTTILNKVDGHITINEFIDYLDHFNEEIKFLEFKKDKKTVMFDVL